MGFTQILWGTLFFMFVVSTLRPHLRLNMCFGLNKIVMAYFRSFFHWVLCGIRVVLGEWGMDLPLVHSTPKMAGAQAFLLAIDSQVFVRGRSHEWSWELTPLHERGKISAMHSSPAPQSWECLELQNFDNSLWDRTRAMVSAMTIIIELRQRRREASAMAVMESTHGEKIFGVSMQIWQIFGTANSASETQLVWCHIKLPATQAPP